MPKRILFILLIVALFFVRPSRAAGDCSVSVSQNSLNPGETGTLVFNITNNDVSGNSILFIKITVPSGNFVITNATGEFQSVDINGAGSEVIYRLSPGVPQFGSGDFTLGVTAGGSEVPAASFGIQVSDIIEGDSSVGCSGDTGVAIISAGPAGETIVTTIRETTTVTNTNTVNKIVEFKDTTPPSIALATDFKKVYTQAPEVVGRATDSSRIAKLEYSIDNGANWLMVGSDDLGEKIVQFSFIPDSFEDGNYNIVVRATDGAGNTGLSNAYTLVIDRLPPLVGASMFALGPLVLNPDTKGFITTTVGVTKKVILTESGGPITVDLFVGDSTYSLQKSFETGLWSGNISFTKPGVYKVGVKSVDGAENITEGNIATIVVVAPGIVVDKYTQKPLIGATVRLFQKDEYTGIWYAWEGMAFNQVTPQVTDENGNYNYFLPQGEYYFRIEADGYNSVNSNIFNITNPTPINSKFELTKKNFPIQFNWDTVDVAIHFPSSTLPIDTNQALLGTQSSEFTSLRGKPAIITFLNTWFPSSIDQIHSLDELHKAENSKFNLAAVMVQEKSSKTQVFAKRGGYSLSFIDDADGTIANRFSVMTLPTHIFLDRGGTIEKIVSGVLTQAEIEKTFEEIR